MSDNRNAEITQKIIEAPGKKDLSQWPEWLDDGCVLNFVYPNRGDFPEKITSAKEIMFHFNYVMEKRGEVEFFNIVVSPTVNEDVVFAEFEQKSWVPRTQKFYEQIYVGKFIFRNGKLVQWDFYHDPQRTLDAFGGADGVTEDLNHQKVMT